jgi:hypothetical protein
MTLISALPIVPLAFFSVGVAIPRSSGLRVGIAVIYTEVKDVQFLPSKVPSSPSKKLLGSVACRSHTVEYFCTFLSAKSLVHSTRGMVQTADVYWFWVFVLYDDRCALIVPVEFVVPNSCYTSTGSSTCLISTFLPLFIKYDML